MSARKRNAATPGRMTCAHRVEALPAGTRSVVRTCEILQLVGSSVDGVTVTEVGEALGLPKSSAHRYLNVLEVRRFVERDRHNKYRLGLGMLSLQSRQTELLVQHAQPFMEAIRDRYDETVNLGVLSKNRVVYLEILESTKGIRHTAQKGDEDFVHSTALGKVIASSLSEREVLELLARTGMPRQTAKTIIDPALFLRELAVVRSKGYAADDGENEEEARCIAVLIPDLNVPAAISVSGVAARFPMSLLPEVAESLKEVAAQIAGERAEAPPVASVSTDRSSKSRSRARNKRS